jgi:hypothetical protein
MTTRTLDEERSPRRPSPGRLGAFAAVTPVTMYLAWNAIAGWGSSGAAFLLATLEITLGAVVAGWIVGGRVGCSIPRHLVGLVAYGFVGALVLLPLNVAGSTIGDVRAGRVSGLLDVVATVAGYVVYGLVSAAYVAVFLLPFGAAWMITFVLLRRALGR